MKKLLLITCLMASLNVFAINSDLVKYLPLGTHQVDLYQAVAGTSETNKVLQKLQVVFQSKWGQKWVQENMEAGKPLPYHKNFGITEAEYNEFLRQAKEGQAMTIKNTGIKGKFKIIKTNKSSYTIVIEVNGQSRAMHLNNNQIRFIGFSVPGTMTSFNTNKSAVGKGEVKGFTFKSEEATDKRVSLAKMIIGQITNEKQCFANFTFKKLMVPNKLIQNEDFIIKYPCKF